MLGLNTAETTKIFHQYFQKQTAYAPSINRCLYRHYAERMAGDAYQDLKISLVPRTLAHIRDREAVESIRPDGSAQVLQPITFKQIFSRSVQQLQQKQKQKLKLKRKLEGGEKEPARSSADKKKSQRVDSDAEESEEKETKKYEWPFQYGE